MRLENILINDPELWEKATKVALRMKSDYFKVLNWWLDKLNKCYLARLCVVKVA
jgi:hypothetical protein